MGFKGLFRENGFQCFASKALSALRLLLFAAIGLQLLRFFFLLRFRGRLLSETGPADFLAAMARGFGYDAQVGFYLSAPVLLLALAAFFVKTEKLCERTVKYLGGLYSFLLPLVGVVSIGYIDEYNDLFNHFLFGIIYDDREAILKTVWQTHNVILELSLAFILGWLVYKLHLAFQGMRPLLLPGLKRRVSHPALKGTTVLLLLLVFVSASRGGVSRYPIQFRDRDVTRDEFLNRMVLNPYSALRYAIKDHRNAAVTGYFKKEPTAGEVAAALRKVYPGKNAGNEVDQWFAENVKRGNSPKARHVFILVMESYPSWPFLKAFEDLGLVTEGKKLGAEGVLTLAFQPTGSGTMSSLAPLIAGMYTPGVMPNYLPTSAKPYATGLAENFRKQGFKTRLFTGGSLSWQRLGEYAKNQGFDEAYGVESIKNAVTVNEWGVDDGSLFSFIESKLDDSAPTFNLVLTTGNHPTYSHDVYKAGWKMPPLTENLKKVVDGSLEEVILGHLWYSDQMMAAFSRRTAQKLPNALIAVTGDHFSRKFPNGTPDQYQSTSVPLLLYGPSVLAGVEKPPLIVGGHSDLGATVFELSFPQGAEYHAIGRDLLTPAPNPVGVGPGVFIGKDYVIRNQEGAAPFPLEWAANAPDLSGLSEAKERYANLALASWWRIRKGGGLAPKP